MTLCDIRPLKGVEPSKKQVLIAIKIKILANFDFDRKKVYKVSDSVLVLFTKCENAEIESFFVFQKPLIANLSANCEPFFAATVAGRETTPLIAERATVSDLCACQAIHREKITHDTNALRKNFQAAYFLH